MLKMLNDYIQSGIKTNSNLILLLLTVVLLLPIIGFIFNVIKTLFIKPFSTLVFKEKVSYLLLELKATLTITVLAWFMMVVTVSLISLLDFLVTKFIIGRG